MEKIIIEVNTDCIDPENALIRQTLRYKSLFPHAEITFNKLSHGDIPLLAGIIDKIDATSFGAVKHLIVCNVAPRTEKRYDNGGPFCYVHIGNATIIGTPEAFVLLRKLGIIKTVQQTDVRTVCTAFLSEAFEVDRIARSQFRSFDYVPLLALWLSEGKTIPCLSLILENEPIKEQVWLRDNFGNLKTTITSSEIEAHVKKGKVKSAINGRKREFPFYERLSEVPLGVTAFIVGSSGYGESRFVELVAQGRAVDGKYARLGSYITFP